MPPGIHPKIISKSSAARINVQAGPKRVGEKYEKDHLPWPGSLLCAHTEPHAQPHGLSGGHRLLSPRTFLVL